MKGNVKKLGACVIIAAIAMLIMAATASAYDYRGRRTTRWKYAFTAPGSCLIAVQGFNASLQPNGGATGPWFTGPVTYEGVLTFNSNGTGSVTAIFRELNVYSQALGAPPDARAANARWDFVYTLTAKGKITMTYVKGSYEAEWTDGPNGGSSKLYLTLPPWNGTFSPDRTIFSATCGAPNTIEVTSDKANTNPTGVQEICNFVMQGFLIRE